jgi:hypothetical protein
MDVAVDTSFLNILYTVRKCNSNVQHVMGYMILREIIVVVKIEEGYTSTV